MYYKDKAPYLKHVLAIAIVFIKKMQWASHSDMDGRSYCPICYGYKPSHKKNCIIAAFIRNSK